MFISHTAHKSPLSGLFPDKTQSQWIAIELALNHSWFLVSFRQCEVADSFSIQRTMLIESMVAVEQFIQANSGGTVKIDSVQVVTPSHINGSDNWKMDVLESVLTAEDPENAVQTVDVFVTRDGIQYVDSLMRKPLEKLRLGEVRFRSPGC